MTNFTVSAGRAAASATILKRYHDDFGPGATGRFDFTILFEDVFLSIVPSVFLLLLGPLRMYLLYKQPLKVKKSSVHESKMVSTAISASATELNSPFSDILLVLLRPRACTACAVGYTAKSRI